MAASTSRLVARMTAVVVSESIRATTVLPPVLTTAWSYTSPTAIGTASSRDRVSRRVHRCRGRWVVSELQSEETESSERYEESGDKADHPKLSVFHGGSSCCPSLEGSCRVSLLASSLPQGT